MNLHPDLVPAAEVLGNGQRDFIVIPGGKRPLRKFVGITGADLDKKEFPPLKWIVPGLLPEGLVLLAGRIKLGKSWLAMDLSSSVSFGGYALGNIKCEEGDVLHLALEDNEPRLKARQRMLLGDRPKPERVEYLISFPRLDEGGIDELEAWIANSPKPRLIIIDTIKMVRRQQRFNESIYDYDYSSVELLRDLANKHSIGIVSIHHLNKRNDSEDPFDLVSGSNGLSACADATFILNRDGQGTTLYGRGRDIEEFEKAVQFDRTTGLWRLLGSVEDVRRSDERTNVLDALANINAPASPTEIAGATGQRPGTFGFCFIK
jgi:AAA domain